MGKSVSKLVGSVLEPFTGAKATQRAAETAAQQQAQAARDAAYSSAFRPVGMTTRFGTSQFTEEIDPRTGMPRVTGASYEISPELLAIQNRLMGLTGGALTSAEEAAMMGQPLGEAAQGLFGLGGQLLPTDLSRAASPEAMAQAQRMYGLAGQVTPTSYDPRAAAQSYYNEAQAMMDPSRQREEQRLGASVFGRGRAGLNISGQGQPELFALSQARSEQDMALAAQARERARQELQQDIGLGTSLGMQGLSTQQQAEQLARARFSEDLSQGAGLFGTGASLLGLQYGLPTQALAPLQSYLGTVGSIEEMGQQPYRLGMELGGRSQQAGQAGGSLLGAGLSQAANTRYQGVQAGNAANAAFLQAMMGAAAGGMSGGMGGGGGGVGMRPGTTGYGVF
jgi:hypothetical protein